MPKLKNAVCPRCKGTGIARDFNRNPRYTEEQYTEAVRLFDLGKTYREIMKEMGLKHPQTVYNLLHK